MENLILELVMGLIHLGFIYFGCVFSGKLIYKLYKEYKHKDVRVMTIIPTLFALFVTLLMTLRGVA